MLNSILISLGVFVALLGGVAVGRWIGLKWPSEKEGAGAVEGVVFAVLGLLIAFTFTSAGQRFDTRRVLVVEQTNAIGTAWMRVDLLEQEDRRPIRDLMVNWMDIATGQGVEGNEEERDAALQQATGIQNEVWNLSVAALEKQGMPPHAGLVLPPLNQWIDLTTKRDSQDQMGLPPMVLPSLVLLAVLGAILAGIGLTRGTSVKPVHVLAFGIAVSFSIYVILDLYDARGGLIQVDNVDTVMIAQNDAFKAQLAAEP